MSVTRPRSLYGTTRAVLGELRDRNRTLFLVTFANLALAIVFTVLMAVDSRMLLGRNVWTKPWKFATSIAIFTATMGWILPSLSLTDRVERLVTATIGAAMAIEITLISAQAARGVASHYNTGTSLDRTIFMMMGVTITISTLAVAYALWRVVRNPPALAPAYLWGLVLGMVVFVVTSFEGWLMISQGGHSIGATSNGPALPLLNWSLTGGDLRVSHLVGLHALQVLPLTGYYAARWDGGSSYRSLGVVGVVGALYCGLTGITFVQALRGTPLVGWIGVPSVPVSGLAALLLLASFCGTVVLATRWRQHAGTDHSALESD